MMLLLLAAATQEEVLRSISSNFDRSIDPLNFLMVMASVIGTILLIVWVGHYRKKAMSPKRVNHSGKLLREMTRKVGLKPAELKKLRAIAEEAEVSSPIVLLLCPSLISQTVRKREK